METKKSVITELNLQNEKFNDMFIFTVIFENGDIGKIYKKKDSIYEKIGDEVEYTISPKGTVKFAFKGESKFGSKPNYSSNNSDAKEDIRFSVAFKGAIDLASTGKIGIDEVEKYTVMYDEFLKDKKSVEMPF
tara:strand:+ start:727 stop:1125 length:399 start_codon:yes stop_codon:yes gene_type:complete